MESCRILRVAFLFPYKPNPDREEIMQWNLGRLSHFFPEFDQVLGSSDPRKPFNRSQAINNAFKIAEFSPHPPDILIIADLDTTPLNRLQLWKAIGQANMRPCFAFTQYANLSKQFTRNMLDGLYNRGEYAPHELNQCKEWAPEELRVDQVTLGNVSGMLVMQGKHFINTGGFDERFIGWGYEDNAFAEVMNRTCGGYSYLENESVMHLYHPPAWEDNLEEHRRLSAINEGLFNMNYRDNYNPQRFI